MSAVTFSVPVSTGTNTITTTDVLLNGADGSAATWNTTDSESASNSLQTTLQTIVDDIPILTTAADDFTSTAVANKATRAADVNSAMGNLYTGITANYVKTTSSADIQTPTTGQAGTANRITRAVDVNSFVQASLPNATASTDDIQNHDVQNSSSSLTRAQDVKAFVNNRIATTVAATTDLNDIVNAPDKTTAEQERFTRAIDVYGAIGNLSGFVQAAIAPTAGSTDIENHEKLDADGNPLQDDDGNIIAPTSSRLTRAADVKSFVDAEVTALIGTAPEALDTLGKIKTAFESADDTIEGTITTLTTTVSNKANTTTVTTLQNTVTALQTTVNGKASVSGNATLPFNASTLTAATKVVTPLLEATDTNGIQIGATNYQDGYRILVQGNQIKIFKGLAEIMAFS